MSAVGIFIAFDILQNEMDTTGQVNVQKCVGELRRRGEVISNEVK